MNPTQVALSTVFVLVPIFQFTTAEEATIPAGSLRAGGAIVDITPLEFPVNLPGGFEGNMATTAHDLLHARALVLDDGSDMVVMVVVDNLGVEPGPVREAKEIASMRTGIPVSRMLVSSTHTHSAPGSNVNDGNPAEVAYRQHLIDGVAESIVLAHANLQPAAVGVAVQPLPEEVFNRRWYLKPGKMQLNPFGEMDMVKMNPGTSPDVLDRPAGPTDPDITIISVQNASRKSLALFANYSLHYVGGVPRGVVSADYFGEFSRLMMSRLRGTEDFVAMMSNGTSGDINNIPFLVNRPPREPFEQIQIVAQKSADAAWLAHSKIEQHRSDVTLDMLQREVVLQYRKPTPEQLEKAKAVLKTQDEASRAKLPRLAEAYAKRTLQAAARPETVTVLLQVIRVGDLAICCIPFETLVEIGLELKDRSPFAQTMVIGLANGRHGYLPTPAQHRLGGYETWLGTNHVQKDASDILTANLLEMLAELPKQ